MLATLLTAGVTPTTLSNILRRRPSALVVEADEWIHIPLCSLNTAILRTPHLLRRLGTFLDSRPEHMYHSRGQSKSYQRDVRPVSTKLVHCLDRIERLLRQFQALPKHG
jgi:hypothetical protein